MPNMFFMIKKENLTNNYTAILIKYNVILNNRLLTLLLMYGYNVRKLLTSVFVIIMAFVYFINLSCFTVHPADYTAIDYSSRKFCVSSDHRSVNSFQELI